MRNVILFLSVPLLLAAPAMAETSPKSCKPGTDRTAFDATSNAGPRKLGDMPDAAEVKTVYRVVDGCPKPVVLRKGIGSNPTAARPPISGDARPRSVF